MEGVISGVDGRRNTIEGRRFGCYERNVTVSTQWQRWWGAAARPGVDFGRGEIGAIVFLGGASSDEEKDVLERSAFCCSLCCSYSCCWSWSCNMRIVYMEIVKIYNICVLCLKHREVKLASKTSRDDASVLNPWKKNHRGQGAWQSFGLSHSALQWSSAALQWSPPASKWSHPVWQSSSPVQQVILLALQTFQAFPL